MLKSIKNQKIKDSFSPWDLFVTFNGHTTNHIMGLSEFPAGEEKHKTLIQQKIPFTTTILYINSLV